MGSQTSGDSLAILLQEMHDIDLPGGLFFWPPAPGWWIMATLFLSLAILGACGWHRRGRLRRAALGELGRLRERHQAGGDQQQLVAELSLLLRRLALAIAPRKQVAGLHGTAWLGYLDRTSGSSEFSRGAGQVLRDLPYRSHGGADVPRLLELVELWIRRNT